jgi:hypothetical protein
MTTDKVLGQLRRIAERLSEVTGIKWTVGYIGNCDHRHDDRSWMLFAEHPGRVGTHLDRIGGVSTEQIPLLIPQAQGALRMALLLENRRMIAK